MGEAEHGAATQVFAAEFDRDFLKLPSRVQERIEGKLYAVGLRLRTWPHQRLKGSDAYKLRVGNYRIIYLMNNEKNELNLVAIGHRREIYRNPLS